MRLAQRGEFNRQVSGDPMKFSCLPNSAGGRAVVSRRRFLKTAAAFTFASTTLGKRAFADSDSSRTLAYVGTDTSPVDGAANGKGIYLFEQQRATGELTRVRLAAKTANPTWLAVHPSGKYLYAGNEVSDFEGKNGSVSAFAIDRNNGALTFLNAVNSEGAGPAYVSLDATGKYAFVANYFGGDIAVLPIRSNGSLAPAVDVHRDIGHLGSLHATDAPAGSFAISGHDAPHAHMILSDPTNRFVMSTDLGQDRIYIYRFDARTGKLTPAETPFVSLPTGDGPRHFVFHRNRKWMYSVQEEASTIVFFHYDSRTGALSPQQTISTLPSNFTGTDFASEIMLSPDGRFLYAGNRLHNSIAVFAVGARGHLRRIGETMILGDYPSQFNMDPRGNFLYACNQRSDQITSFRIDKTSGGLAFTGQYAAVGTPLCITFLA